RRCGAAADRGRRRAAARARARGVDPAAADHHDDGDDGAGARTPRDRDGRRGRASRAARAHDHRRARRVDARLAVRDPVRLSRARPDRLPAPPRNVGSAMGLDVIALPVRRPIATSMFFLALALLGLFAWYRIPIELMPALRGEQLVVSFARPGSEPAVVEREILLPLEARVGELPGRKDTWGAVNGASGRPTLPFAR